MHYFNSLSKASIIPHNIYNIYIRTNANVVTEGPERYRLKLQQSKSTLKEHFELLFKNIQI